MFDKQNKFYEFVVALRTFSVVLWNFVAFGAFGAILVLGLSYFPFGLTMTSHRLWSLYIALAIAAIGVLKTAALLVQYYIGRAHYMNYMKRSNQTVEQVVFCDPLDR